MTPINSIETTRRCSNQPRVATDLEVMHYCAAGQPDAYITVVPDRRNFNSSMPNSRASTTSASILTGVGCAVAATVASETFCSSRCRAPQPSQPSYTDSIGKTVNPDPSKIGFLERHHFKGLKFKDLNIDGTTVRVVFHKRIGHNCTAEIVGGPEAALRFSTKPTHRNTDGNWEQSATQEIRDHVKSIMKEAQEARFDSSTPTPANAREPLPKEPSKQPSAHQQKSNENDRQDLGADNNSSQPEDQQNDVPVGETTPCNHQDQTCNETRKEKEEKVAKALAKKEKVNADPNATEEEKAKCKKEHAEAVDDCLEQIEHDRVKHDKSYKAAMCDKLDKVANSSRKRIEKAQAKIAKGAKCQRKADRLQKKAKFLESKLDGSDKLTLKNKNGKSLTVSKEQAESLVAKYKQQASVKQNKASTLKRAGRVKAAYNGAKGSAARELKNQIKDAGSTLTAGVALGAVDGVFDVLQGKCSPEVAVTNTATNVVKGTVTYAASSIMYEAAKGAINATVKDGARKIPCLGTCMKVADVASIIYNAPNHAAAGTALVEFGVDVGGEAALLAAVGLVSGGVGIPAMIGTKIAWRAVKWFVTSQI